MPLQGVTAARRIVGDLRYGIRRADLRERERERERGRERESFIRNHSP